MQLLDFLRWHDADTIYLVGDIIDGWQLRHGWHWPQTATTTSSRSCCARAAKDRASSTFRETTTTFLRGLLWSPFRGRRSRPAGRPCGRRWPPLHRDARRPVRSGGEETRVGSPFLGDHAYTFALALNTVLNWVRRRFGLPYWSISKWAKARVKEAVNYIGEFEKTLSIEADRHRTDGVICGHIHHAVIRKIADTWYVNCGDWVESCSAVVEHFNGEFEILTWTSVSPQGVEDAAAMEVQAA